MRLVSALMLVLAATAFGSDARSAPDEPNDVQALENVWSNTLIVFPDRPSSFITRGRNLDRMLELHPVTGRYPAVVFMHGSTGLSMHSTQVTKMIRSMAEAGFVVFAPDSLARPVAPYADATTFKSRIGVPEVQARIAEADMVRKRIASFAWVDADNISVAGFSMGAMTVHNIPTGDFRAYIILGYHCGPHSSRQLEGVKIPFDKPILAIRGQNDEWYAGGPNAGVNCGMYFRNYTNAQSIVYPRTPHDVSQHPDAMKEVVAFLRKNAMHEIAPVASSASQVPSSRFDGTWAGLMECSALAGGKPFTNVVNLQVASGTFKWRIQVPAGVRGFSGSITEPGEFSASGLIGANGLLEDVPPSAENTLVKWAIVFGGPVVDDKTIEADGGWGTNPCKMTLRKAA